MRADQTARAIVRNKWPGALAIPEFQRRRRMRHEPLHLVTLDLATHIRDVVVLPADTGCSVGGPLNVAQTFCDVPRF